MFLTSYSPIHGSLPSLVARWISFHIPDSILNFALGLWVLGQIGDVKGIPLTDKIVKFLEVKLWTVVSVEGLWDTIHCEKPLQLSNYIQ